MNRKTKGFTLVELLVVIAIIALLMGILMPALARVRAIAFRMVCGTNLSGIGKAMLIYANDYDDELPRAGWGGSTTLVRQISNWTASSRVDAFGNPSQATVTASFYELIKFAEVTTKSFVCKSDSDTKEFKLSDYPGVPVDYELVDVWDFGTIDNDHKSGADGYCSYSYHHPYCVYALTTSSDPGMAVAADRNPWIIRPPAQEPPRGDDDWNTYCDGIDKGDSNKIKMGNALAHQEDGQNVLFVDSHVDFEKSPACGVDDDNIYTRAVGNDRRIGDRVYGDPVDRLDSFLIGNGLGTSGSVR